MRSEPAGARPLRVLWFASSLQPGGGERNIVSVMPHVAREGASIALVTQSARRDGPLAEEFAASGLKRFDLGARRLADPAALARLVRLVRGARVDVIHSQDLDANLLAGLAGTICRVPVVMGRNVVADHGTNARRRARMVGLRWLMAHRAAAVVAVSEAVRDSLIERGVPAGRVRVVHNGVDTTAFLGVPSRAEARRALGWDPDAPVVLLPAVLRKGKGHDAMIAAAPAIRRAVPGARIVFVGGGPLLDAVRRAASSVDGVEVMGYHPDMATPMAGADLIVLPSENEGLPTVLIEAALVGRPAVATRVGGCPEVVADGDTGLLVPPGDVPALAGAVSGLLGDPVRAGSMGQAARRRAVDAFSLGQQARGLVRVYEEVAR